MIALVAFFFIFLIFFGFIGATRGWAKEFLVIISVILALAFITLAEDLVGLRNNILSNPKAQYWFRMITVGFLVFFGYLSPTLPRFQKASEKRARISEHVLGFFIGMISGYFVIGTLWAFSSVANYPSLERFIRPVPNELADLNNAIMNMLPPVWLDSPTIIFIILVLSFIFAMIYFL